MFAPRALERAVRPLVALLVSLLVSLGQAGCAAHEPGRYQVASLSVEGNEELAERPLESCLITRARPKFHLSVGLSTVNCGDPPFDSQAPRLNLWTWWWKDWPAFNHAVFDADLERIERWYQARGYYDAQVVSVTYDPPEASDPARRPPCDLEEEVCPVRIVVTVEEGEPTLISDVRFQGIDQLDAKLQAALREVGTLEKATPIDEARYENAKDAMRDRLREAGYADPSVEGVVHVDTDKRRAEVEYQIASGQTYSFGRVRVEGHGSLPERPIVAAASLEEGTQYRPAKITEMQTEVFALGAFSSVQMYEELDRDRAVVDVRIEVVPHSPHALRLGVGILSGAQQRTSTGELTSIPQWDTHVFARYEKRHVFGTLGRFTIEERPRLIFSDDFPRPTEPAPGNLIRVGLNQPGLIEKRTDLFTENAWDLGPDPFLRFWRSDIYFRLGARRGFFSRRLLATVALQQDLFLVDDDPANVTSDGSQLPSSYGYSFLEQDLRLDLRDNRQRPAYGAYFAVNGTEAVRWRGSDWTAFRLAPEARVYVPLPLDVVWASRAAIAGLFITAASDDLDETSRRLGPNTYRLRGGGANSNRGFLAGQLGVGRQGGIRRWELSTELRIPFGRSVVLAGLADLGDVNDQPFWRFDHINLALGGGLRFYTILGAIRLDVAMRVLGLQTLDGDDLVGPEDSDLFGAPGALHLTIGDAF